MRKRVLFILFCFLILFIDSFRVEAATDYSLNYEVTNFNLSNNVLTIDGWAFIHHLNSKGASIKVYLDNGSGHGIEARVSQSSYNLTAWMKSDAENCSSRKIYNEDVGFHAVFDQTDIDVTGNYTLGIFVQNGSLAKENNKVAVAKKVASIDSSSYFKIDFLSEKVDTSVYYGYLQNVSNGIASQANGNYFSQTTQTSADDRFTIAGITKAKRNKNNSCGDAYSEITFYGLKGKVLSNQNCGFYEYRTVCFVSSNASDAKIYYAPGSWVVLSGNVSISACNPDEPDSPCSEPEDYDSVCSSGSAVHKTCSSKKFKNACDSMKIRTTSDNGTVLSAFVSIDESGEFRMKDYSSIKVTAGRSFAFGLQYIYNLNWRFNSLNCNGVDEGTCKKKLYDVLASNKYFGGANANNLESNLKNKGVFQAIGYEFQNDDNFDVAGFWSCSSNSALAEGHLTIVCDYKIKDAYINYYTNYVTYSNHSGDNNYKSLGPYFYLPLDYNKGDFRWNISTDNLSLIKLRTELNNYDLTVPSSWEINTVGNISNKCSVKVLKNFLDSDNSLVYRSVDTNIDTEDDLKLYYLVEGSNWYNYFYDSSRNLDNSKFVRIRTSFENLHYVTTKLARDEIKNLLNSYDSKPYTNWENINSDGKSKLIMDSRFFNINNNSKIHCKWGDFSDTCDKYS